KKEKDQWVGKKNTLLKPEAVLSYFGELSDLRSSFILDKVNEELQGELQKYLDKPAYEIVVSYGEKDTYRYQITGLVKSLPGLKLEKWQTFIVKPSNREFPYILNKKVLNLFHRSERRLRSFPVKKLFY
ncbi:MAG: hypothetical protein NXH75_07435, partial [Halobacteriovoraceae bacterium]|nr:hypothetical protein [Halobacteriovoraceae bacterium]